MKNILKILKKFPLLIPSHDFTIWKGIITIQMDEVLVTICTPSYPSLQNFSVLCHQEIKEFVWQNIDEYKHLKNNLNSSGCLLDLLEHLARKCNDDPTMIKNSVPSGKLDYKLYHEVLGELKQLGNDHVVSCAGDLSELVLRVVDGRGVDHRLVVGLPRDYPSSRLCITHVDLPDVALPELNQAGTLLKLFNAFHSVVESFQGFWDTYDQLTKNTWVIDPEVPRCKDTHCRIVIDDNVSMVLTLNPQEVNSCPDIKFLGPENAIFPFLNTLERRLKISGWDEDISVLDNLISLLGVSSFPQRPLDCDEAAPQGECDICFMMRTSDQALPSHLCNNPKCNSHFHITCLAQWFQAVPTNETSFNLISGDCPCCSEKILCPIKMT